MKDKIVSRAKELFSHTVSLRRDFHKYPESGFMEFRTVAQIIEYLRGLGVEVKYGEEVINTSEVLGMPDDQNIENARLRAIADGADESLVRSIANGATAVVATIYGKAGKGNKTVAFRFDIDSNELVESESPDHLPCAQGFASVHNGSAHACAHDGHAAIGLTLAKILSENTDYFSGKIKLIFQPAEEGVRGADAMVAAGVVDDVDVFFSGHIGISAKNTGTLFASTDNFLCATKYDAEFFGASTHAGLKPEEGKNALLAAAQAALSLHAISRHSAGASRINVGVISGGSVRNVIPSYARIEFETRGINSKVNAYMKKRAEAIIASCAMMYDVEYSLNCVGNAESFEPDMAFGKEIAEYARSTGIFSNIIDVGPMNASEDCTAYMNRVISRGGKATYMMFGADLASQHHTPEFDFDEKVLSDAVALLALLAIKYA
jgi:aminobenzoyl-glutamate utilization protein A